MRNELLVSLLKQRVTVYFRQIPPWRVKDRSGEVKTCRIDGTYDWEHTIVIDLKKRNNAGRVFLHELVHRYLGIDASETTVIETERKLWRKLTTYERWLVYHLLFRRQWKEEE